jgi:hypothetical protein
MFFPPPSSWLTHDSPQAKKRHLIEKRLQTKLRKETDSVRRQEEAKKSKNTANRREEDVQLKDSIVRLLSSSLSLSCSFRFLA